MTKNYFPSLESLAENFVAVLKRFPLELLFAAAGTWAALQTTFPEHDYQDTTWLKVIMCSNLGLVFSLSATTFAASLHTRKWVAWLLRALVMAGALFYYFTLPEELRGEDAYRFFLFAAVGHLLVSVAPFWERGNIGSFWYYNKSLFLRFLTAALYSAVLFAGLAVALLALDELFGMDFRDERYFQLWIVIAGLFNTIMFLAGVPARPLRAEEKYPKALKVFTQYVLIPLVSIYVLILLAYELKILIQWDLPRGWVSNLIIAFAVFGVLSLLLVFPVRHSSENKWIVWYGKIFHWILLPLVGLLFLAIITRIADYGFTGERFFVLATGIWLLFTALYFLSGRKENIKMVPASLIIFILLTATLAFPVSINSQQQRLLAIFAKNNMLETDGDQARILAARSEPSRADRSEITSIVQYLYEMHGTAPFRPYFSEVPESTPVNKLYGGEFTDSLLAGIRLEPAYKYDFQGPTEGMRHFNISMKENAVIPTSGYDFHLSTGDGGADEEFRVRGHVVRELFLRRELAAGLIIDGQDTVRFDLQPLLSGLVKRYLDRGSWRMEVSPEEASLETETVKYRARLYLVNASGMGDESGLIDTASTLVVRANYLLEFKD